jgi:hypothetical protein
MHPISQRLRVWSRINQVLALKIVAASFNVALVARIIYTLYSGETRLTLFSLLLTETFTLALIIRSRLPLAQAVTPMTVALTLIPCAVMPLSESPFENGIPYAGRS